MVGSGSLVPARLALHAVAEHVLAADLYARTGHIGLRVVPGGFATPAVGPDGASYRVRVVGTDIVVEDGGTVRSEPLTTVGRAAAFVGIEPGGPAAVYPPLTPLEPEAPLGLDPSAVRELMDWMALGDEALRVFADDHRADSPTEAQLWPEHFDLALSIAEVNYGVSPGDAEHDEPYLYVGPWAPPAIANFWNEPFGARLDRDRASSVGEAVAFFEQGRSRL